MQNPSQYQCINSLNEQLTRNAIQHKHFASADYRNTRQDASVDLSSGFANRYSSADTASFAPPQALATYKSSTIVYHNIKNDGLRSFTDGAAQALHGHGTDKATKPRRKADMPVDSDGALGGAGAVRSATKTPRCGKRRRNRFTEAQKTRLLDFFNNHSTEPNRDEKCILAFVLNLSFPSITYWFQNMRQKRARCEKLSSQEGAKIGEHPLVANLGSSANVAALATGVEGAQLPLSVPYLRANTACEPLSSANTQMQDAIAGTELSKAGLASVFGNDSKASYMYKPEELCSAHAQGKKGGAPGGPLSAAKRICHALLPAGAQNNQHPERIPSLNNVASPFSSAHATIKETRYSGIAPNRLAPSPSSRSSGTADQDKAYAFILYLICVHV